MLWVSLAIMVAMLACSFLLQPKTTQPSADAGDLDFPTASAGKPIPVLFGSRWVTSPNVVWYGDIRTRPIRTSSGK